MRSAPRTAGAERPAATPCVADRSGQINARLPSENQAPSTARSRRGFWRNSSGAALVEFSLIAFVLLFTIFATVETALVYWATEQLEHANNDAARQVRTGVVQNQSIDRDALKTFICQRASMLPNCVADLRLDVRSADTYASIQPPDPLNGSGEIKEDGEFAYAPGGPESAALVTAFFSWPVAFFGGPYLLRASVPLRNEPF